MGCVSDVEVSKYFDFFILVLSLCCINKLSYLYINLLAWCELFLIK